MESFFALERFSSFCRSRNFVCLYGLAAALVASIAIGWLVHPLIGAGLFVGLAIRIWWFKKGTLRPHSWSS